MRTAGPPHPTPPHPPHTHPPTHTHTHPPTHHTHTRAVRCTPAQHALLLDLRHTPAGRAPPGPPLPLVPGWDSWRARAPGAVPPVACQTHSRRRPAAPTRRRLAAACGEGGSHGGAAVCKPAHARMQAGKASCMGAQALPVHAQRTCSSNLPKGQPICVTPRPLVGGAALACETPTPPAAAGGAGWGARTAAQAVRPPRQRRRQSRRRRWAAHPPRCPLAPRRRGLVCHCIDRGGWGSDRGDLEEWVVRSRLTGEEHWLAGWPQSTQSMQTRRCTARHQLGSCSTSETAHLLLDSAGG